MPLKNVNDGYVNPLARTSMRGSWTQGEGGSPAFIHEGHVVDVNLNNWTVDVRTQFDNKFFPNVQIASPYVHYARGEGLSVMPDLKAKCYICIPSDGPPPFVLSFIMPAEQQDDQDEQELSNSASTYSGGRSRAKFGDIQLKGRDGQFVVLHRGGVLQIGSTELAQRIYIPLGNIIADISQNYEHHSTGGCINWGISSTTTDVNPETCFTQTFRVHANDEKADIRITTGHVKQPTAEPAGDAGEFTQNTAFGLGVGGDNPIVMEVCVAPQGFDVETGDPTAARNVTKLKYTFDKAGNAFLGAAGNVNVRVKKKLRLVVDDDTTITTKGILRVTSNKKVRIDGKDGVEIVSENGSVLLNGGGKPVAVVGSPVTVLITVPLPIKTSSGPGIIEPGPNAVLSGYITGGSPSVFAPGQGL